MNSAIETKIKQQQDAIRLIKRWPSRVKKIVERKKDPLSETMFCKKHGINLGRFNRIKNGTEKSMPSQKIIDRIEDAFKAEGV